MNWHYFSRTFVDRTEATGRRRVVVVPVINLIHVPTSHLHHLNGSSRSALLYPDGGGKEGKEVGEEKEGYDLILATHYVQFGKWKRNRTDMSRKQSRT